MAEGWHRLRNPVTRHIKSQHWSKWFQDGILFLNRVTSIKTDLFRRKKYR
jgi:uracil DNA glycosylase